MSNYEFVKHPQHYKQPNRKECIEEMIDLFGIENTIKFCEMNAYKYQYRKGRKPDNSIEQEESKIQWYEDKAQELRGRLC